MKGKLMRILVISDSHGRCGRIEQAIEVQPTAKHIFFLGDCVADIEDYPFVYPDRTFYIVSGNCDYSSVYKSTDTAVVGGKKIFFTHGHHLSVKYGIGGLKAQAEIENADIVLFGHTHEPLSLYLPEGDESFGFKIQKPLYLFNPGSIGGYERSFGCVTVDKNGGVLMSHGNLER